MSESISQHPRHSCRAAGRRSRLNAVLSGIRAEMVRGDGRFDSSLLHLCSTCFCSFCLKKKAIYYLRNMSFFSNSPVGWWFCVKCGFKLFGSRAGVLVRIALGDKA